MRIQIAKLTENQAKRSNGCETGHQNKAVLVPRLEPRKKRGSFSGRSVFSLDPPFNG